MTKKLKKIVSVICASVLAICTISNVCFAEQESDKFTYTVDSKFNDVKTSDWFYEAVSKCEDLGIICGYGDGKFGPNDPVTMWQVCMMSLRCLSIKWWPDEDPDQNWLKTAFSNDEFANVVAHSGQQQIIPSPFSNEQGNPRFIYGFEYDKQAYREEALSCLYRTYKRGEFQNDIQRMNEKRGIESKYIENPSIPDFDDVSDLFKNDIKEAYKLGLASGYDSTGAFKPKNEITRAEFCQIMLNSGIIEILHFKNNGQF